MKAATIYDVAKRAGVSHQTVSRYLAGFEGIRPQTRSKVESALAELDYRPNSAARFLRLKQINRIGVLAHRSDLAGPARILAGATAAARDRGYVLDIVSMNGDDDSSIQEALAVLSQSQIAGIIATAQTDAVLQSVLESRLEVPIVIDAQVSVASGGRDMNELAGAMAADHLIDLGHRRLAYLSGPRSWLAAQGRRLGFLEQAAARSVQVISEYEGDWSAASGYRVGMEIDLLPAVTAVAAGNDSMAIGFVRALWERGISVPLDVSVIGTDDAPDSAYLLPALSSVAIDFDGEGAIAVASVVDAIEGTRSLLPEIGEPRPIPRGSTGPAPL